MDPLAPDYPQLSPYHFSHNSPIFTKEIEGLEGEVIVVDELGTTAYLQKVRDANILEILYSGNVLIVPAAGGGNLVRKAISVTKGDETYNRVKIKTALYDDDFGNQYMVLFAESIDGQTEGKPMESLFDAFDVYPGASQTGGLLAKIPKATGQLLKDTKSSGKWLQNILKGIAFENKYFSDLAKNLDQGQKLQRRVSFVDENGLRAVVDGVVKNADNSFRLIETKLRKSTALTTNQKKVYKAIENGTAKPVGMNANEILGEDAIGKFFKGKVERINKYND